MIPVCWDVTLTLHCCVSAVSHPSISKESCTLTSKNLRHYIPSECQEPLDQWCSVPFQQTWMKLFLLLYEYCLCYSGQKLTAVVQIRNALRFTVLQKQTHLLEAAVDLGSELKEEVFLTNACDFGQICSFGLRGLSTAWHHWYCNRQTELSCYHMTHTHTHTHTLLPVSRSTYVHCSTNTIKPQHLWTVNVQDFNICHHTS